jgi:predicted TIM-barrel fold metal-dependent hydrolase
MSELIISADSHVIEPNDLWTERLPARFKEQAPKYAKRTVFEAHDGGKDPVRRVKEMAMDGVSCEVLYASLALNQFALTDAELQEACFRVYNDWLIEYCSHAPDRLIGLALISAYNIDNAIAETIRCKKAGMRGITVWQVPPDGLSFTTTHYDRLWATCQELNLPVSLHILTGMPYGPSRVVDYNLVPNLSGAVNRKLLYTSDSLLHIIGSGTLDRFPNLKIVVVEAEVSWLPYCLAQWDRYLLKTGKHKDTLKLSASGYFERQIHGTFFNDPPVGLLFRGWGTDNCMWSNDFPHGNSTWPKSREVIERDLGHLPEATRAKLLWKNVVKLYDLPTITSLTD